MTAAPEESLFAARRLARRSFRDRAFPGGDKINRDALATRWIERNAAAGYVLIGDPAVRLRAEELAV